MKLPALTLLQQQIRFSLCAGIPRAVVARELGISLHFYDVQRRGVIRLYGCETASEFALNANAAVQDRMRAKAE